MLLGMWFGEGLFVVMLIVIATLDKLFQKVVRLKTAIVRFSL